MTFTITTDTGATFDYADEDLYERATDWYNRTSKEDLLDWWTAVTDGDGQIWDEDGHELVDDWADIIMREYADHLLDEVRDLSAQGPLLAIGDDEPWRWPSLNPNRYQVPDGAEWRTYAPGIDEEDIEAGQPWAEPLVEGVGEPTDEEWDRSWAALTEGLLRDIAAARVARLQFSPPKDTW